ncbi:MAG: AAA family ATPase [Chloroflexi bacterium]|nr:AAA family ATPase [Chloroflexota bacterium]
MSENIKVLVAADTTEDRIALNKLLAHGQYTVLSEASLGPEAVSLVKEFKPDIVLLSMEEPVARPLRTLEGMGVTVPDCPVIVVSSLGDRDHLRRAMRSGARDYLIKPVSADDFRNAVAGVVDGKRKRDLHAQEGGSSPNRGEIITVFGAKGGIGKSTLATNLAVALALQTKQRVALVDLDIQFGDVALMLNLVPDRTIADVANATEKLDLEMVRSFLTTHVSGVGVLAAPLRPEEAEGINVSHVRKILETLSMGYDYVIVDTPPALNDSVLTALDLSTLVLMMTTLEVSCIKRTRMCLGLMKSWHYPEGKVKLVVNHTSNTNGLSTRDVEAAIDHPLFWKIPNDSAVASAARMGKAFVQVHPNAKVTQNLVDLCYSLSGQRVPARGFAGRFMLKASGR